MSQLVPCPNSCPEKRHYSDSEAYRKCLAVYQRRPHKAQGSASPTLKPKSQHTPTNTRRNETEKGFYFGSQKARTRQDEIIKSAATALEKPGSATQILAACGTGKSYMGRNVIAEFLSKDEDSPKAALLLVPTIKLAQDSAKDINAAIGDMFDDNTVVIEVHSGEKDKESINDGSEISLSDLEDLMVTQNGKKIIVVSTYQSSEKIQQLCGRLTKDKDGELIQASGGFEFDIMVADEAHNITGISKGKERDIDSDGEVYSFNSFHNSMPNSIQAKRRLYMTATPEIVNPEHGPIPNSDSKLAVSAAKGYLSKLYAGVMKGKGKSVDYVDSSSRLMGGVSGFITMEEAEKNGYLVPMEIVKVPVRIGGSADAHTTNDRFLVGADGQPSSEGMSINAYGASVAMLESMVTDRNQSRNGLLFADSIDEAKHVGERLRSIAMSLSEDMGIELALRTVNAEDLDKRRRARLRVLADTLSVKTVHSGLDKKQSIEAFKMFDGSEPSEEWSPDCRVMTNVDMLSEGVDIPNIDVVAIASKDKTRESKITQAAGRAVRVRKDDQERVKKRVGRIVVPQVLQEDDKGNSVEINGDLLTSTLSGLRDMRRGVSMKRAKRIKNLGNANIQIKELDSDRTFDLDEEVKSRTKVTSDMLAAIGLLRLGGVTGDAIQRGAKIKDEALSTDDDVNSRSLAAKSREILRGTAELSVAKVSQARAVETHILTAIRNGDVSAFDEKTLSAMYHSGMLISESEEQQARINKPEIKVSRTVTLADGSPIRVSNLTGEPEHAYRLLAARISRSLAFAGRKDTSSMDPRIGSVAKPISERSGNVMSLTLQYVEQFSSIEEAYQTLMGSIKSEHVDISEDSDVIRWEKSKSQLSRNSNFSVVTSAQVLSADRISMEEAKKMKFNSAVLNRSGQQINSRAWADFMTYVHHYN